jgi:putative transposase
MAMALRTIYAAPNADAASAALEAFERGPWGQKFPTVVASWRRAWTSGHSLLRVSARGP